MENVYDSLEEKCKEAGTNITRACKKAGVTRSTLTRWKQQEPLSIRLYRKLEAVIESEKVINNTPRKDTPLYDPA